MMPTVRSVIAASTAAGSRQKSSASMSAKTGVAPVSATELAVAAKVNDGTMTSSPALTPADSRPRCRPDVPELTATQARPRPKCAENSSSKALTSGPWASMPLRSTRSTAARSSSPMSGFAGGMNAGVVVFGHGATASVRVSSCSMYRSRRSAGRPTSPDRPVLLEGDAGLADPADPPGRDAGDEGEVGDVLGDDRRRRRRAPSGRWSPGRRRRCAPRSRRRCGR